MIKIKSELTLFFKGMFMGMADIIPGVSGGTIALILGVYKQLINSISKVNLEAIKILKTGNVKYLWRYINGKFLLILFSGIITSIIILSKVVLFLLKSYSVLVWAFFFGLVLASIFFLLRRITKLNTVNIFVLIIFSGLAYMITKSTPSTMPNNYFYIFISGFLAIIAMILPGISGSFVLLLLGSYQNILNLVNNLSKNFIESITGVLIFVLGCILGLLSFSRLLNWMLKNYHDMTMSALIGVMIGTLGKIWPWKKILSYRVNSSGEKIPLLEQNIIPDISVTENYFFLSILLTTMGIFVVILLGKVNKEYK